MKPRLLSHLVIHWALWASMGCASLPTSSVAQRDLGMVYILPGIDGGTALSANIAAGLRDGGVRRAVEIYDWSTGTWIIGMPVHYVDRGRNRDKSFELARHIADYKKRHPDKPVHLIGHSGGAALALQTVRLLPGETRVDGVILLAAAVAKDHDLRFTLQSTESGVWNFYSQADLVLAAGTTIVGDMQGRRGFAAGAVGFKIPSDLNEQERTEYATKLHQIPYSFDMSRTGHLGGHFGWATRKFAADWLAPLITGDAELGSTTASGQRVTAKETRNPNEPS